MSMAPPEGEEERSQAYYVIKVSFLGDRLCAIGPRRDSEVTVSLETQPSHNH